MPDFFLGVIEGFYGRHWPWSVRRELAEFLKANDFWGYVYAPKSDTYLRSNWQQAWPREDFEQLLALAEVYSNSGTHFGVGLSPMGLVEDFSPQSKKQLKAKLETINQLNPDLLCILFDDMPGANPDLAKLQLDIVAEVLLLSDAGSHIICPSYYSYDPVLEQIFGTMPVNYWQQLGEGLPQEVGVFWTGDKVISSCIDSVSLVEISALFGRKPVIWDNVFANDGKNTADYLPLLTRLDRAPALKDAASGVCINPMNQSEIAKLALRVYQRVLDGVDSDFSDVCDPCLSNLLKRDADAFTLKGLGQLTASQSQQYLKEYATIAHPQAEDVCSWLRGEYKFDPACLTG